MSLPQVLLFGRTAGGANVPVLVGNDGSLGGGVASIVKTLTAAEVAALGSTPITVLAAQGANTLLVPVAQSAQYLPGTVPFANNPEIRTSIGDVLFQQSKFEGLAINELQHLVAQGAAYTTNRVGFASALANQPLVLTADGPVGFLGPFTASTLGNGGTEFAPSDLAIISSSDQAITGVNQGTKTFTLDDGVVGYETKLLVTGSTGNDAFYTIASSNPTAHTVTTVEAIPSAVADGQAYLGTARLTVSTVTNGFAITAVNQGNTYAITAAAPDPVNTFVIDGDHAAQFTAGKFFVVTDSTGNDKTYKVSSSAFVVATTITIDSAFSTVDDATADGNITVDNTVTVAGNHVAALPQGDDADIFRSTANDDTYTIYYSAFAAGSTTIGLFGLLPNGTVDGYVGNDNADRGVIATYTIGAGGLYGVGGEYGIVGLLSADNGNLTPTALTSNLSDGQIRVQVLYYVISLLT